MPNQTANHAAAEARRWLAAPDVLILDTETSGLDLADGQTLLDSLVRPTRPIPRAASRVHGITDADVADAPTFADLLPRLRDILGGATVLIYNADFDVQMLEQSLAAHGLPIDDPVLGAFAYIDVLEPYSAWCGDWSAYHGNYRWQRLPGGDHTALGDCRAVRRIIRQMAGEGAV